MGKGVRVGFEAEGVMILLTDLLPLKQAKLNHKSNAKYQKVMSSIRELGIIEPLAIFPQNGTSKYLLLDGHLRLEALKNSGTHTRRVSSRLTTKRIRITGE